MPSVKPSFHQCSPPVKQRIIISQAAATKVQKLARRFRYRRNPTGSVIDLLIDSMVLAGMALPDGKRGPNRLDEDDVREIRGSADKLSVLACRYKVTESMISQVRSRVCYRWVI